MSGWIYESPLNNVLELTFLLNLSLTSTTILFEFSNQKHSPAVIYASSGTVFVIFVGIILYHAHRRLCATAFGAKLKRKVTKHFCCEKDEDVEEVQLQHKFESPQQVTHTVVDLIQPLLEEERVTVR